MKYSVFTSISLFAGSTAFAPIAPKKSFIACSPFAAPKKLYSLVVVPTVVPKISSTALNLGFKDFVDIAVGLLGIFGAYLAIKNDIKSDFEKQFNDLKTSIGELKTANLAIKNDIKSDFEKQFNDLKTSIGELKTANLAIKNDIKSDFEKQFNDLKTSIGELKTANEKNFDALKTDLRGDMQRGISASEKNINRLRNDVLKGFKTSEKKFNELKTENRYVKADFREH
jgi:septal ring factor EnvC (AmiA/AmiB activator)